MADIKILSNHCKVCIERQEIYFDNGVKETMRPKCWDLLELLIKSKEKSNGILLYSTIEHELWENDYDRDTEQARKDTMSALKKALHHSNDNQLIRTIQNKGYQLINDIHTYKEKQIASVQDLRDIGYSSIKIAEEIIKNDEQLYENLPEEYKGTPELWAAYIESFPDFWKFIVDENGKIQGNFSLIGISEKEARLLSRGEFNDSSLKPEKMVNLYKAGTYIGYLANLSVNPEFETSENYNALWKELCNVLINCAEQSNVYFKKIYYKAFILPHTTKVAGHGFRPVKKDSKLGDIFVQDMNETTINAICDFDACGKKLSTLYEEYSENNLPNIPVESTLNLEQNEASKAYFRLWNRMNNLFLQQKYFQYRPYFFDDIEAKKSNKNLLFFNRGIVLGWWVRNLLQYMEALLPYIPKEQRSTHRHYKEIFNNSFFVIESKKYYEYTTEAHPENAFYEYIPSVKSLVSFTNIWLDIDELFMKDDVLPFLDYFFMPHAGLPEKKNLEMCETLAIRIMTALKCAEEHLENIPIEFVNSYINYKEMLRTTSIMWLVSSKYPFLKEELDWAFNDRPNKPWQQIEKDFYKK